MIGTAEFLVVVLNGGRQVTCHDLGGIMIDRQGENMFRIDIPVITVPRDDRDRMGNHGNLQGMLRIILRLGVPHEGPAADQLEPGKVGKKRISHRQNLQ